MELQDFLQLIDVPHTAEGNRAIRSFQVDSREVQRGDIFFALPGEKTDGHHFLAQAAERGAMAAVVRADALAEGLPSFPSMILIPVDDVLCSLQKAARQFSFRHHIPTIAITGSVGKTTTKEFLTTILEGKFRVTSTPKNCNSQIGLPLALLNHIRGSEDWLVLEMAMTHKGQIAQLVEIAPPDIALLLSVELVHACNFVTKEDIALAKGEIFSHPQTRKGILYYAVPALDVLLQTGRCEKWTFAHHSRYADVQYAQEGRGIRIREKERSILIENFPFDGHAMRHNFVAAALAAREVGMDWEEIVERVPLLRLPEKRGEYVEIGGILFVNDSYNASEVSMKAALERVADRQVVGKKMAVLGSMLELGKFTRECHERVGEYALECVDRVYCFGEECEPIARIWKEKQRPVAMYTDKDQLLEDLRKEASPGDLILLKGSSSKAMWEVLEKWR